MQRQGSKPPSLAQIYEWLLQPEKLLKPLHSMTFTLLHLIYLALRRAGWGAEAEAGVLFLPSLFKIRDLRRSRRPLRELGWGRGIGRIRRALDFGCKEERRGVSGVLRLL